MQDVSAAFAAALGLIGAGDPAFLGIVGLSLRVTLTAMAVACLIGMPFGALLAVGRFPGRAALTCW